MKQVQNLGFKVNNQRDSKSRNDRQFKSGDKFERKAGVQFKLRKQRLTLESFSY
jgi:hypothetical protein